MVDPVTAWLQMGAVLSVNDLIAAGGFLVSGAPTDYGREPALASIEQVSVGVSQFTRRRGARNVAEAVGYLRNNVDSRPESRMRMLLVRSGLPEPLINDVTFSREGVKRGTPDLKCLGPHGS